MAINIRYRMFIIMKLRRRHSKNADAGYFK